MKKHPCIRFRIGSTVAVMCILSMLLTLSACFGASDAPLPDDGEKDTQEAVTLPPLTLPDLTDDRMPTDTALYTERLESLFADTPAASASDFTYEKTDEGITVTGYTGGELIVVIPETIEELPVTAIAPNAFQGMGNLKAVSVPDSVTSIGKSAFEGCKSLSSLRTPVFCSEESPCFGAMFGASSYETNGGFVPVSLSTLVLTRGTVIPDYCFYACRGLETVSLPDTLTETGDFAFYGCEALAYITTAETCLTSVGVRAFAGCTDLLNLYLPATVTCMGSGMLEGCGKLESLTIPFVGGCTSGCPLTEEEKAAIESGDAVHPAVSTAYLGYLFGASDYTFTAGHLPASLITVTVLEGCTAVPPNAFFECASIREVNLPEGVTEIGRRAFYGCEKLAAMTLPDSVVTLGDDALNGCIRLQRFTGGAGLTTLGIQAFMNCLSLTDVTLPDGVTNLPNSCFSGCVSLTKLTAEGVKTQGNRVFHNCEQLQGWSK